MSHLFSFIDSWMNLRAPFWKSRGWVLRQDTREPSFSILEFDLPVLYRRDPPDYDVSGCIIRGKFEFYVAAPDRDERFNNLPEVDTNIKVERSPGFETWSFEETDEVLQFMCEIRDVQRDFISMAKGMGKTTRKQRPRGFVDGKYLGYIPPL